MPSVAALKIRIESALANRIPAALTPVPRTIRPVVSSGIGTIDDLLEGGLPQGAITEVVGSECSGRTAFALSFIARLSREAKVCAWIDASDSFHPESAAASGVDLARLLWVRCGVPVTNERQQPTQYSFELPEKYLVSPPVKKGLHGGGHGPHPRNEVKGLSDAVGRLLHPAAITPRCAEPQCKVRPVREGFEAVPFGPPRTNSMRTISVKPWSRLEQALRVTDLLLQGGGFSAMVLDMGSIAPEHVSRIPLATWFRYRAASERAQTCLLLLTQHTCSKSSAGLVLRLQPGDALRDEATVFMGIDHRIEVMRQRFTQASSNVIPLRKPPQRENAARWTSHAAWAGRR